MHTDVRLEDFTFYFAYGSCMNHASLSASIGCTVTSYFAGPAVLDDYRLAFNYGSVREPCCCANIEPAIGRAVHGALFRLPASLLGALDVREGVSAGRYVRQLVHVRNATSDVLPAITYKATVTLRDEGAPSSRYRALFMQGLLDSDIPEDQRRDIEKHIGSLPGRTELVV